MDQHIYTIDINDPLRRFEAYHCSFAHPAVSRERHQEYLHMLVEQMIAHFEVEVSAVVTFMQHYTLLITDPSVSPLFKYHPLKFLKQMDNEEYKHYIYCLFGFAEDMFKLFQAHRLYSSQGKLLASYQHIANDVLYLIVRPEVSNVLLY